MDGTVTLVSDSPPPAAPAPPDTDVVDATLAASGDTQAFERLYYNHVARIHGLARRINGADDADEAVQVVFVRAWEKLGTFRGEAAFGTWLHRVAINVLLGLRERRGRWRDRHPEGDATLDTMASRPAAPVGWRLDLEAAMARLPRGARRVFVLHDVEGYKHREIAQLLGVSVGTSKAQLHRARMALREYLEG